MNERLYYVYILASSPFGAIYIGMTNQPVRRILEHREGRGSKHCSKYKIFRLVHIESFERVDDAIDREKRLKRWRRSWKDALIAELNPGWHDQFADLQADPMVG